MLTAVRPPLVMAHATQYRSAEFAKLAGRVRFEHEDVARAAAAVVRGMRGPQRN
jgi:hypothetical protein